MADWHVSINNQAAGPYSQEQVRDMLLSGRLSPASLVWTAGMPQWAAAHTVPQLAVMPPPISSAPPMPLVGVPPTKANVPAVRAVTGPTDKRILPAFLLAFFIGMFGAHRFYVGKTGSAVAMLLISLTGIGLLVTAIWALVDWIMIICGLFTDKEGRKLTEWT